MTTKPPSILSDAELAELEARADAAKKGPWHNRPTNSARIDFDSLIASHRLLAAELERVKAGRLTPEEFQNLCHNLSPEDKVKFFDGCDAFQRQVCGESRTDGMAETIRGLERRLSDVEGQTARIGGSPDV